RAAVWRASRATSQTQPGGPAPCRLPVPGADDLVRDRRGTEGVLRAPRDERPAPEPAAVGLLGEDRPALVGEPERAANGPRRDAIFLRPAVEDHAVPRTLDDARAPLVLVV